MHDYFTNLYFAITKLRNDLIMNGQVIQTEKWQGLEKPPAMIEIMHVGFTASMPDTEAFLINQTGLNKQNLDWCTAHFEERIGREPLNPGEAYKIWPWYGNEKQSNARFQKDEKFSHTYMERYWPKLAGKYKTTPNSLPHHNNMGIRYQYGDLSDVICLLKKEPYTRQAYLPIWFPEDTGVLHGGRVPCSLGYHFMLRNGELHVHYSLRSCDAVRHFRNDIYLTVKLVHWVLERLRRLDDAFGEWHKVTPGFITMQIMSFHAFEKEKNMI